MKQEKALILAKYQQYEKKIKDQRKQLTDAHSLIQKLQQVAHQEQGNGFQHTWQKLLNSEKNLDQLKIMYHQLASQHEVQKKDMLVMDKKLRRGQQKQKEYQNQLQQNRMQVVAIKHKFRQLTEFIQKKGGIEVLNSLPNDEKYKNTNTKNEFEDYIGNIAAGVDISEQAQASNYEDMVQQNQSKKIIRGGKQSISGKPPTIRGGQRTSSFASSVALTNMIGQQEKEEKNDLEQSNISITPSN
jgi:hypothetical protein